MKFLTVISLYLLPFLGFAQSVTPEVIASAGDHYDNGSVQLSWTLGEVMIDTYENGNNVVTQGFHQTQLTVTSIERELVDVEVNVYPNPTSEFLNIDLGKNGKDINIQLYDMSGKLIHQDVINAYDTRYVMPMQSVATGKYLVQMQSEDGKVNTTHQVVKLGVSN